MKVQYLNPFLTASLGLFREYIGGSCEAGEPFLNKEPQKLPEVSGIIGLAGDTVGAIVLSFERDTAIRMVSKLAGKPYSALGNEVLDGVGELVNIIAGNAKRDLLDYRLVISLPGVIVGENYSINWPQGIAVVTIPFHSELGHFSVSVSLKD